MSLFVPREIYVEEAVADLPFTRQVIDRCIGVPVRSVPCARELIAAFQQAPPPGFSGKRCLLLCRNRGRFIEPCPGTAPPYRCCRYVILNTGTGCPLDCSYCVLQAYLNNPFITLFANRDELAGELSGGSLPPGALRLGTGEYMDSLALEHLTGTVSFAAQLLRRHPRLVLELKTKTTAIEALLEHDCSRCMIAAWSLNSLAVARAEEHGAAPVPERIAAAARLAARGYRVAFHFDPLIHHPGWQAGYRETIAMLAAAVPPERVAWVSVGSLRFMPPLKRIAEARFPSTAIYTGEFVPGLDGKMRYLQDIRLEMYREVIGQLRRWVPDGCIYYCMEHPRVWQQTMGWTPASNDEVKALLDARVRAPDTALPQS